jgi:2-haloacid dehalogenase
VQDIKALAFDTGGTVLDWHSGIAAALAETGRRHGIERDWARITNDYRRHSLQRMTGAISPDFNIDDVNRDVLERIVAENELTCFSAEDRRLIAQRWHELEAWPDFAPALDRLRQRHVVVSFTILSLSLIIDVSRRNHLAWDGVLSCEMLDVYKPRPEAYRRAARLLRLRPGEILMVACHNFDLMAARQEGYRTAFVHRPAEWGEAGPPDPNPNPAIDVVVPGFSELAQHLAA